MKIDCAHDELLPLEKLVENPRNPNKHPEKQIDMLAKIINHQGQRSPIVVSKRSGFIIKGHGRLEAIRKLGWEKAAVDFQSYESEAQEYQDMVADNRIAELADHDDALMLEGIKDLELEDSDLELMGLGDLKIFNFDDVNMDDSPESQSEKKQYILEVKFPNDMEMMDAYDDLLNKGYIVTVK